MQHELLQKAYYIGDYSAEDDAQALVEPSVRMRDAQSGMSRTEMPGYLNRTGDNNLRGRLIQMSVMEIIS
ncbi:MAG: hypothetical protein V4668_01240 [Patescibacteria group bacterium]